MSESTTWYRNDMLGVVTYDASAPPLLASASSPNCDGNRPRIRGLPILLNEVRSPVLARPPLPSPLPSPTAVCHVIRTGENRDTVLARPPVTAIDRDRGHSVFVASAVRRRWSLHRNNDRATAHCRYCGVWSIWSDNCSRDGYALGLQYDGGTVANM